MILIASDHGHETTGEIVPLERMLIEAGFKAGVDSTDVVVASNGLSAFIYMAPAARERLSAIVVFLNRDERIDRVITAPALADVGHRTDTRLAIAVTGSRTNEKNEFGIPGIANAFEDPLSPDTYVGCGQHGGLGTFEQHPFLLISGAGFAPGTYHDGETSALDIAPTILRHLEKDGDGMDGTALQSS